MKDYWWEKQCDYAVGELINIMIPCQMQASNNNNNPSPFLVTGTTTQISSRGQTFRSCRMNDEAKDAQDGARDSLGQQTNHRAWWDRLRWRIGACCRQEQIQAPSVPSSPQLHPCPTHTPSVNLIRETRGDGTSKRGETWTSRSL